MPAIAVEPGEFLGWARWILPNEDGLGFATQVFHEYVGIAYYAARGRWVR